MKKNKINIYQADFVFMLEDQARDFAQDIIWKYGKIIKEKYKNSYGYIYRCQFATIDEGINCLIECMNNRIYAIAINQRIKEIKE